MNTRKVCTAGACALVLGVGCLLFSQVAPKSGPAVNQESLIIQDFENRIADYVKLHKEIQAGFPAQKPTDSAAELAEYRLQMAPKIRAATAKQGDIFTSEISGSFRRLIGAPFSGPEGDHLRASLRHAEPVHGTRLHVNATYPAKVPLQSTPPTLLLDLPQLPSEVEYRIVGRDLVLRDVGANLAMFWFAGSS
jgi:hypothetical protein